MEPEHQQRSARGHRPSRPGRGPTGHRPRGQGARPPTENVIVNDVQTFTDREAWDAVAALEHMVLTRGLVTAQQVEAERRAAAVAVLMGEEVAR